MQAIAQDTAVEKRRGGLQTLSFCLRDSAEIRVAPSAADLFRQTGNSAFSRDTSIFSPAFSGDASGAGVCFLKTSFVHDL